MRFIWQSKTHLLIQNVNKYICATLCGHILFAFWNFKYGFMNNIKIKCTWFFCFSHFVSILESILTPAWIVLMTRVVFCIVINDAVIFLHFNMYLYIIFIKLIIASIKRNYYCNAYVVLLATKDSLFYCWTPAIIFRSGNMRDPIFVSEFN